MADTIITNTPSSDSGAAGWVIALIVVAALVIGGIVLYQSGAFNGGAGGATDINVTIPTPTGEGAGAGGGAAQ